MVDNKKNKYFNRSLTFKCGSIICRNFYEISIDVFSLLYIHIIHNISTIHILEMHKDCFDALKSDKRCR